ncbi:thioesterase II family protein, partial [Couchioplanes azureus]|uniref:thioesterase II family protein n=1 Tax=Couchioplanes caeruleus TaxID=56438 RepID=UPI001E5EBEFD
MTTTRALHRTAWLRQFHRADAPTRVVCFPHAGGAAGFFFPTSRALSDTAEVLTVQYPGRQDRRAEPYAGSIAELTEGVARELAMLPDLPLVLFGHSMGALVAYELAARLHRDGGPPVTNLVTSGCRAPSRWRPERLHLLDDDQVLAELSALSGTHSRILGDAAMMRLALPPLRADFTAMAAYHRQAATRVPYPITALVGGSDPKVAVGDAAAWRNHTTGGFELHVLPGGHFYLESRMADVVRILRARLAA